MTHQSITTGRDSPWPARLFLSAYRWWNREKLEAEHLAHEARTEANPRREYLVQLTRGHILDAMLEEKSDTDAALAIVAAIYDPAIAQIERLNGGIAEIILAAVKERDPTTGTYTLVFTEELLAALKALPRP